MEKIVCLQMQSKIGEGNADKNGTDFVAFAMLKRYNGTRYFLFMKSLDGHLLIVNIRRICL